ncbi:hypothetical protein ES703_43612 [subsurface metagenome]
MHVCYVTDPACVLTVVIGRRVGRRGRQPATIDAYHTVTVIGLGPAPNLDEVPVSSGHGKGSLRVLTTVVVIEGDHPGVRRGASVPIIDGEPGVEAAATEADGGCARARSGVAVPEVPAGHVEAGTIGCRAGGVEVQVRYVTDRPCVVAVVVGRRGWHLAARSDS